MQSIGTQNDERENLAINPPLLASAVAGSSRGSALNISARDSRRNQPTRWAAKAVGGLASFVQKQSTARYRGVQTFSRTGQQVAHKRDREGCRVCDAG